MKNRKDLRHNHKKGLIRVEKRRITRGRENIIYGKEEGNK
jgi:hypothetical protein